MPTAQIDSTGTEIYYIDSGAPYGKPIYTTVVIVHGFCINGGIFERLLPFAAKYGLRIIAMNSRDYAGSTPYTVEELSDYTSHNVARQAAAVRRWGNEIGRFLAHVCRNIGIPRATGPANRQTGGLVLVTWSLSTMAGLSILGDPRTLGENLAAELSPYLRKIILYDPSALTAGANPNLLLTWPFADPLVPLAEKGERFNEWVSAYYTPHPDGAPITAEALHARAALPRPPTMLTLSAADAARLTDPGAALRSALVVSADPGVLLRHARTAYTDAVLPHVALAVWWCDSTFWMALWGAKVFEELMREEPGMGRRKRRASILNIRDANHFVHWEEPERMVRLLAKTCGSSAEARL